MSHAAPTVHIQKYMCARMMRCESKPPMPLLCACRAGEVDRGSQRDPHTPRGQRQRHTHPPQGQRAACRFGRRSTPASTDAAGVNSPTGHSSPSANSKGEAGQPNLVCRAPLSMRVLHDLQDRGQLSGGGGHVQAFRYGIPLRRRSLLHAGLQGGRGRPGRAWESLAKEQQSLCQLVRVRR